MRYTEREMTEKLNTLMEQEGFEEVEAFMEEFGHDSVMPGVCMRPDCDGNTGVEPDQMEGWCPVCNQNTVMSAMELYLSTDA